jgi:hypothetical protein
MNTANNKEEIAAIMRDCEQIYSENLPEEERKARIKEIIALHYWDYHKQAENRANNA